MRPPTDEYSPSLFSRTTQKSMSPSLLVRERARHAGHQPHRPQVDVLLEAAADRDQQAPQRHVVGHAGEPDRAEVDGVVVANPVEAVLRHHAAGLLVVFAAPGELVPLELDAEPAASGLQHADALGHDFLADAVSRDGRDRVLGHDGLGSVSYAPGSRRKAPIPLDSSAWYSGTCSSVISRPPCISLKMRENARSALKCRPARSSIGCPASPYGI